ncbi:hypothetical protein V6N13_149354 [Hibiscus sabdariffa]
MDFPFEGTTVSVFLNRLTSELPSLRKGFLLEPLNWKSEGSPHSGKGLSPNKSSFSIVSNYDLIIITVVTTICGAIQVNLSHCLCGEATIPICIILEPKPVGICQQTAL